MNRQKYGPLCQLDAIRYIRLKSCRIGAVPRAREGKGLISRPFGAEEVPTASEGNPLDPRIRLALPYTLPNNPFHNWWKWLV